MTDEPRNLSEQERAVAGQRELERRRAAQSRRQSRTVTNLVAAVVVTLAAVAVIVFLAPHPPATVKADTDYTTIARQAADSAPAALVAPRLPKGWSSNRAALERGAADGIEFWYIGLLTPDTRYIGIKQGFHADDRWIEAQTDKNLATGASTIDGVTWTVYDHRDTLADTSSFRYAMVRTQGVSTFVLYGTGTLDQFRLVAKAIDRSSDVVSGDTAEKGRS